MAATIVTQPVADTGAGVSDGEAQRPYVSEWLETVNGREHRVIYWRPGGALWWIGRCRELSVTAYGVDLETCRRRLQLEIAARTEAAPCE